MPRNIKIKREHHTIDASQYVFGRLASKVAVLLRGKHKPTWRPNVDCGDWVEIVNLDKLRFTGNKLSTTFKYRHSGYPGGLKKLSLKELWTKDKTGTFRKTVYGMLPKNKLTKLWLRRLKITTKTHDTKGKEK